MTQPKVALIPGGARGIGRAVALDLARDGWAVALCYRQSEAQARATAIEAKQLGAAGVIAEPCDISSSEAAEAFAHRVEDRLGRIDALINCVGPYHRVGLLDETAERWRQTFDSNLHSLFYLARVVTPGMRRRGWGRIISFSLANADQGTGQTQVTAHYIAKAGVLMLTRALAKAVAAEGITANTISPGFIDSGSTPADELARMRTRIPAGTIGTVEDAVACVRFLLSEEARYVNGANIQVSGGWGV